MNIEKNLITWSNQKFRFAGEPLFLAVRRLRMESVYDPALFFPKA
jgi:hypothetical protein